MASKTKLRVLGISTLLAIVLTVFVTLQTGWPFWIPLGVFLFWGPVATLVIEKIAASNPNYQPNNVEIRWLGLVVFFAASFAVAGILRWKFQVDFLHLLAYTMMTLAFAGGINGIVMESEDNAPGGFLNPTLEQMTGKKTKRRR